MPQELLGIQGMNPVNVVWLITFFLVCSQWGTRKITTSNYFSMAFMIFLIFYTVAALWTAIDIKSLHPSLPSQNMTAFGFLLMYLIKPAQIIMTGWMVYKYCQINGVKKMENAISLIPIVLLPFMTYYFYKYSSGGTNYGIGRRMMSFGMGMNANEIGGLAMAILAYNLGKAKTQFSKLDYISIACTLLVIVFSLSRMAFITTLVIFLISLRKFTLKQKVTSVSLLLLVVMAFTPLLLARISFRVNDNVSKITNFKKIDVNELSANRIDYLWKPSLRIIAKKPILGDGLLSIWKGNFKLPKDFTIPTHPHNAYIQVALDMGFMGIIVLMVFLSSLWKCAKNNLGFKYALISWFLMGLTGSTFYPELFTLAIWLYYGITCAKPREDSEDPTFQNNQLIADWRRGNASPQLKRT